MNEFLSQRSVLKDEDLVLIEQRYAEINTVENMEETSNTEDSVLEDTEGQEISTEEEVE